MIQHSEYQCDTEGCTARLFDIISELGMKELKCRKCKQSIQVNVEELCEVAHLCQKLIMKKQKRVA